MLYAINQLDVWRDSEQGFFINDVLRDCARVNLENPYNNREVLKKVRAAGYWLDKGRYTTNLKETQCQNLFEIVNRKTGKYILQLECLES